MHIYHQKLFNSSAWGCMARACSSAAAHTRLAHGGTCSVVSCRLFCYGGRSLYACLLFAYSRSSFACFVVAPSLLALYACVVALRVACFAVAPAGTLYAHRYLWFVVTRIHLCCRCISVQNTFVT